MGVVNDLLRIAIADLKMSELALGTGNDEIMQNMAAYHTQQAIEKVMKHLLVEKRGYGANDHDLERLAVDARSCGIDVPVWLEENSYEISKWATTIRYNSNFKTNRDSILKFNKLANEWILSLLENTNEGSVE